MTPSSLYTPAELRKLADLQASEFRPFLMNEYRRALRWSANVIEAADKVIEEKLAAAQLDHIARAGKPITPPVTTSRPTNSESTP